MKFMLACVSVGAFGMPYLAGAQSLPPPPVVESATAASAAVNGGVPIGQIIAAVARKSGKKFVVDPRVRGDVALFGQNVSDVTYGELLTILGVYGVAGVESGGIVKVIPDAAVRAQALPVLTGKENFLEDQYVTGLIHLQNGSASQVVPILRPLLPQHAHLAADACANTLIMVDRYSNFKRIEALVHALDVGEPRVQVGCGAGDPAGRRPDGQQ